MPPTIIKSLRYDDSSRRKEAFRKFKEMLGEPTTNETSYARFQTLKYALAIYLKDMDCVVVTTDVSTIKYQQNTHEPTAVADLIPERMKNQLKTPQKTLPKPEGTEETFEETDEESDNTHSTPTKKLTFDDTPVTTTTQVETKVMDFFDDLNPNKIIFNSILNSVNPNEVPRPEEYFALER